jgi:FkbM family methyltransferase
MREVWLRLPRAGWTYKLAKILTRSVLKPEPASCIEEVRFAGRFVMQLDLSDIVGNDLYCMDDHYEALSLALWSRLARDAETIVDLGSHVGLFACAAASVNRHARIIAVEAFGPNVRLLKPNAAQFPNVTPVEVAIGVTSGRRTFRLSPIAGGGYVEHDDPDGRSTPGTRDQTGEGFVLDTIDLAELCARQSIESIDLMKMDLEGLEEALLTGQDAFWERWSPKHVIVEITVGRARRDPERRMFETMAKRGYRYRRLEGLYTIPWFQHEDLANWHFWKGP